MGEGDQIGTKPSETEGSATRQSRRHRLGARLGTDRLFYGWWMVMSGAISNFFIVGVVFYGVGVLYEPMQRDLGWSMAALTAGASVRSFEQGFMAPITGYLTDRFGPRLMALIGISLMAGGLVLFSQVHTLWTYYTAAAITSLGFSLGGLLPYQAAIVNWFVLSRGRAMGLLNTGNGLAYVTVGFTAYLVSVLGWRETVLLSALAVFVVGMPLALTIRTSPEPYGHYPDGEKKRPLGESGAMPVPSNDERSGMTTKEAARTPAFYLLSIAQAVSSLGMTTWLVLTVPHLVNAGFSAVATGSIVAIYGIIQVVLRLIVGWLGDRIGRRKMFVYSFMMLGIGLCAFALLTPERWWLLPLYYITFGGGHASQTVVGQTMVADYFGTKRYATIRGVNQILMMPAGLVAPVIAGWIFDRTGDYSVIMLLYGVIAMTGTIWILLIRRPLWHDYTEVESR